MKKLLTYACLATCCFALSGTALAGYDKDKPMFKKEKIEKFKEKKEKFKEKKEKWAKIFHFKHYSGCGHDDTPPTSVPEMDAANAGIALALTAGIVGVYRERRKSKAS